MDKEKRNVSQSPRIFYARHMQPGVCGYENETILVDTAALKRMLPSAVGKPVYINHQDVDMHKLKEQAAGYITDAFYNEQDGWGWFKFLAIDDECHEAVKQGWKVSNAYVPDQWQEGGLKNNVPYDREVVGGSFTHLAIVPNPRYEDATIMAPDEFKIYQDTLKSGLAELQNSKGRQMFKLFRLKKEEVSAVDGDTTVELKNDKGEVQEIKISEMVDAVMNAKKNADDEKKKDDEKDNGKTMVNVGDEEMPLSELINRYMKMCSKSNADDDSDDEKKKDKEKDNGRKAKKNAESDDDDEDEKKEKKNSETTEAVENDAGEVDPDKHFEELRNAHLKENGGVHVIETSMDQTARGQQRYGTQKVA